MKLIIKSIAGFIFILCSWHTYGDILCPSSIKIGDNDSSVTVGTAAGVDHKATLRSELTKDWAICHYNFRPFQWPEAGGFDSSKGHLASFSNNRFPLKGYRDLSPPGRIGFGAMAVMMTIPGLSMLPLSIDAFSRADQTTLRCPTRKSVIYVDDDDAYMNDADKTGDVGWRGMSYSTPAKVYEYLSSEVNRCVYITPANTAVYFPRQKRADNRDLTTNLNRTGFIRQWGMTEYKCNQICDRDCREEGLTPDASNVWDNIPFGRSGYSSEDAMRLQVRKDEMINKYKACENSCKTRLDCHRF